MSLDSASRVLALVAAASGGRLHGRRVGVLGVHPPPAPASDAPDTPDTPDDAGPDRDRGTALAIAASLARMGAEVTVHAPLVADHHRYPELGFADSLWSALTQCDLTVLVAGCAEARRADPAALAGWVRERVVVDPGGALDGARWVAAGWRVVRPPALEATDRLPVPETVG
ncbi:UDP binding domain-containing protein [Streptomyces sp. BI20]|uniref:UDP binding domain-containing protein n=1 Tax=Streptomyces sp. BI20 TaxID=3403460 RepID=UPI003C78D107